jgi:hypothetical protein
METAVQLTVVVVVVAVLLMLPVSFESKKATDLIRRRSLVWIYVEDQSTLTAYQQTCITSWKRMPRVSVTILDEKLAAAKVPKWAQLIAVNRRTAHKRADLLKLFLLEGYGGVWVDPGVMPIVPLHKWLPEHTQPTGYFFLQHQSQRASRNPVEKYFAASERSEHPLFRKWLQLATDRWNIADELTKHYHEFDTLLESIARDHQWSAMPLMHPSTEPYVQEIRPERHMLMYNAKGVPLSAWEDWSRQWV